MSGTESSGGQSSKGFLHWLKNTWLGKLLNRIVNFFKSRKQNTELGSASEEQGKVVNDNNNNDKSKSSEVGQNKVSKSSQNIEEVREDVQKKGSGPSQTPVNPESPAISRSPPEASLSNASLPKLSMSRDRSQSSPAVLGIDGNNREINNESCELEWDHTSDVKSPKKDETEELYPKQEFNSSDAEEEKNDRQITKKGQNKSEEQHISHKTKSQSTQEGHRKQVLDRKKGIDKESEKKGKETLESSKKKQNDADKKREEVNKQKSKKARNTRSKSTGSDHSKHNSSSPNQSLSASSSSLASSNGQGR